MSTDLPARQRLEGPAQHLFLPRRPDVQLSPSSPAPPHRYVIIVALIASAGGLLFGEPFHGWTGAGWHCQPVLLTSSAGWAVEPACFTGGPPSLASLVDAALQLARMPLLPQATTL